MAYIRLLDANRGSCLISDMRFLYGNYLKDYSWEMLGDQKIIEGEWPMRRKSGFQCLAFLAFALFAKLAVSQESSNIIGNNDAQNAKHEKVLSPSDLDIVYMFIGIGEIVSIDAQPGHGGHDDIMVVQMGDHKIKISNFCSLINYESSSPGITVSDSFDFCTRLKSFDEFHIGDIVRITYERGLAQITSMKIISNSPKEIKKPAEAK